MSIPRTVAEVLNKHVTFELEGIDRMYLNLYVPRLQTDKAVAHFWRFHRGHRFASSALMDPMTKDFIRRLEDFAKANGIPLITFEKDQRKDDLAQRFFASSKIEDGVVFIGKAQEKVRVFRTERRRADNGATYPWIVRSSAMVNQWYLYIRDRNFGPFFLKFSSYFPYNAKLCLNGHEFLKCQLRHAGIPFKALDNGIASCADPAAAQALADGLSAEKIDVLVRKWFARLPHPFNRADRAAGFRYNVSILQAEFSLTQVLDQPVHGRVFFEEVIRENLDIGRPTRSNSFSVAPSLDAPRVAFAPGCSPAASSRPCTWTTRNAASSSITRKVRLCGPKPRSMTRVTLAWVRASRTCPPSGGSASKPTDVSWTSKRSRKTARSAKPPCAMSPSRSWSTTSAPPACATVNPGCRPLMSAILGFALQACGFTNRELRERLAPLLGLLPDHLSQGRMTYDLRRLRLHGLIERVPRSHRYRLTRRGIITALFFTRSYARSSAPDAPKPSLPSGKAARPCVGHSTLPSKASTTSSPMPNSLPET
jgi:hypothetical protein